MKSALGVVLIGGHLSSMFLALILVPVVYSKFDSWRTGIAEFIKKFRKQKIPEPEIAEE